MAKRLSDTEKWSDPWFRKLPKDLKLLWLYLLDRCDMAGCWKTDIDLASLFIGYRYSIDRVLKEFNSDKVRIVEFDNGRKWMIEDFIRYQYGKLSEESRVHKSVFRLLSSYEQIGYAKGIYTPNVNNKDKDKDKDIVEEKKKFGKEGIVLLSQKQFENLKIKFSELGANQRIQSLENGILSKGYKYKSHYHTILSWEEKNNKEINVRPKQPDTIKF